ncbi:MAG: hypothetical protein K8R88_00840 [Armatimonadetes bacterium]|nr:hypothetical protein [Armatimonadota bacterium]
MKRGLPKWVFYALIGLLFLVGMRVLSNGSPSYYPSITSQEPSGTHLYAQLLKDQGYQIEAYTGLHPEARKADLVICYFPTTGEMPKGSKFDNLGKANLLVIDYPQADFATLVKGAKTTNLTSDWNLQDQPKVTLQGPVPESVLKYRTEESDVDPVPVDESFAVWSEPNTYFMLALEKAGRSKVRISDGIGSTNKFISTADNATFYVNAVKSVVKPKGRILFWERPLGNASEPTLLEELSPALATAWSQCLLIFIVVAYTLGKRFGLPERTDVSQQGSRAMLDAFGELLRRSKRGEVALELIERNANQRIRRKLNLASEATDADRDDLLTPEQREAMMSLKLTQVEGQSNTRYASVARRALALLREFMR